MQKTIPTVLAAGLCLALGACSDEPSELAMRDAAGRLLARTYQQQAAVASFVVGPRGLPPAPRIADFRKIGCVPSDRRAAHQCEFTLAMNGADKGTSQGWFYKAEDGLLAMSE